MFGKLILWGDLKKRVLIAVSDANTSKVFQGALAARRGNIHSRREKLPDITWIFNCDKENNIAMHPFSSSIITAFR